MFDPVNTLFESERSRVSQFPVILDGLDRETVIEVARGFRAWVTGGSGAART